MDDLLTKREREHVCLAEDLAARFGARAARHDAENTFPFENFEEMRETGYLALTVPEELGGAGAGLLGLCRAQEALAQGCAATALAVNMHLFSVGLAAERWQREADPRAEAFLRTVAAGMTIVGNTASEVETGGNNLRYAAARAVRVEGGWIVNGRKIFCSLSPIMTAMITHALHEDPATGPQLVHFLAVRDSPGLQVTGTWDAMGMRGTGSNDVTLTDVLVPDDAVIAVRPAGVMDAFAIDAHRWFNCTFAAVYTGIAIAAKRFAEEHVRTRVRQPSQRPMSHFPGVQYSVAEMDIAVAAAQALTWRTILDVACEHDGGPRTLARVLAAKQLAATSAVAVVDKALLVTGGLAYLKRCPLERLYRDVRAATVHPPTHWDALEIIGKAALGVALGEEPRWG